MSLHTNLLWLRWFWNNNWSLVAVENLKLILDIGIEWKWQSTLKE